MNIKHAGRILARADRPIHRGLEEVVHGPARPYLIPRQFRLRIALKLMLMMRTIRVHDLLERRGADGLLAAEELRLAGHAIFNPGQVELEASVLRRLLLKVLLPVRNGHLTHLVLRRLVDHIGHRRRPRVIMNISSTLVRARSVGIPIHLAV